LGQAKEGDIMRSRNLFSFIYFGPTASYQAAFCLY
jgi:hypothetical protein